MEIKNYKAGEDVVMEASILIPEGMTEEELEVVTKYKLIPIDQALEIAENNYERDIRDTIIAYENQRSKESHYSGIVGGVLLSPIAIPVARYLIGANWFTLPVAALIAFLCLFVFYQAIQATKDMMDLKDRAKGLKQLEAKKKEVSAIDNPKTGDKDE